MSNRLKVSPDNYEFWLNHPITAELLKTLDNDFEALKQAWALGFFTAESKDGTIQKNAKNLGKSEALLEMHAAITDGTFVTFVDSDEEDQT